MAGWRAAYVWEGIDRARVVTIPPSIDAFTPKNQPLPPATLEAILRAAGIHGESHPAAAKFTRLGGAPALVQRQIGRNGTPPLPATAPAAVQVSRWDRLKDPAGVLRAFCDSIAPATEAHLVLAAPDPSAVADDPEGLGVLAEAVELRAGMPAALRERVHLFSLPMTDLEENAAIVNALQRRADVILQKSLAEGFGLTVAEAMWKARPVVAAAVGGIEDQIVDGESGRSAAGKRAASSHTGALLAAADTNVDALFRHAGVIGTDTVGEMFDVAALLSRQPPPQGNRVAIVTNAGGPAILCADACEAEGLQVEPLAEATRTALAAALPAEASVTNPVDMIASARAAATSAPWRRWSTIPMWTR